MKRVTGVWFLVLSLIGLAGSAYLRQDSPAILTNQKMTNSAIFAQSVESRSFAIMREPEGMVFDQTQQEQEIEGGKQEEQNEQANDVQPYVQAQESYYQDSQTNEENQSTNIDQSQNVSTQDEIQQTTQEGVNQTQENTTVEVSSDGLTQDLIPIQKPEFQLVEADNDPTLIVQPEEDQMEEKEIKKKEKSTFWRHHQSNEATEQRLPTQTDQNANVPSDQNASLQPDQNDSEKLIATKIDNENLKYTGNDDEDFTTLKLMPMGISKEQFLAMMPVEQELLLNPIPELESYQSSNDIGSLGLSDADILKEMSYSYDPPEPEQISI